MRPVALAAAAVMAIAAAPIAPNWSRTVSITPEGGMKKGNPAAKVKLVEYASLTCPHCAHFSKEASVPLAAYVRSGKVNYEYRSFVLNGVDVAASLIARCGGPARFFPIAEQMYASQPQWMGRMGTVAKAERDRVNALPPAQRLIRVAELTGLIQIAARNGVTPLQSRKCLADPAGIDRLEALSKDGAANGVSGTPTFFINGQKAGFNDWASIDAAIKAAS